MAKPPKNTPPVIDDEEIVTVDVVVIPKESESNILTNLDPFEKALIDIRKDYKDIVIFDKPSLEFAQKGISKLTKIRTGMEKRRKEIIAPMLLIQGKLMEKVKKTTFEVEEIENELKGKVNAETTRIENEKRAESIRRNTLLLESGYTLTGEFYRVGGYQVHFTDLENCTEAELSVYISNGQLAIEEKRVSDLAEAARLKDIQDREAALEKERAELEELRAFKASMEAQSKISEGKFDTPPQPPPPVESRRKIFELPEIPVVPTEFFPLPPAVSANHTPPAPYPSAMQPSQSFAEPVSTSESIEEMTLMDVAHMHGIKFSELVQSVEVRVAYNTAINDFLVRFENEQKKKDEWILLLNQMKKK